MAKKKLEETGVLPVTFFGDVVAAQAPGLITYEYKYGDKTVEVKCKHSLTYNEKSDFVRAVWDVYYSPDESGTYAYRPYITDICIRYLTVKMYCVNIPMQDDKDIEFYENFLLNTDFYDELVKHINQTDYQSLCTSVSTYIDIMTKLHMAVARTTTDMAVEELVYNISRLIKNAAVNPDDLNYVRETLDATADGGDIDGEGSIVR